MSWIRTVAGALLVASGAAAQADDIGEVLERSHRQRLAAMPLADAAGERAALLQANFERLAAAAGLAGRVELRVITGPVVAETVAGRVVLLNERLADLPAPQRDFIVAHELGHVALGHWAQLGALYRRWIPGEVRQAQTDAVAPQLGREASALSHQQEYEADAHGLATLRSVGGSLHDAMAAFMSLGVYLGNATHPGTRQRVAALRLAEQDARRGQVVATRNESTER